MRNNADALIYSTQRTLEESGDVLSDDDRGTVESLLTALKEAKEGDDPDVIQQACDSLGTAAHKLAEAIYADAARDA